MYAILCTFQIPRLYVIVNVEAKICCPGGADAIQRRFDAISLPRNEIKGLLNAWNGNLLKERRQSKAKIQQELNWARVDINSSSLNEWIADDAVCWKKHLLWPWNSLYMDRNYIFWLAHMRPKFGSSSKCCL